MVSDLTLQRKWHFLCHCWLAVDLGDCELDRIFLPASRGELLSFRYRWAGWGQGPGLQVYRPAMSGPWLFPRENEKAKHQVLLETPDRCPQGLARCATFFPPMPRCVVLLCA